MEKKLPANWNEISEWNTYHSADEFHIHHIQALEILDALRYVPIVEKYDEKSVWISCCGKELAPWFYANLGCKVLATDISDVAITFQKEIMKINPFEVLKDLDEAIIKTKIQSENIFIQPELEVHDCRKNLDTDDLYNVIINRQSFNGFTPQEMEKIARVYENALEEGGTLIIDTLNIQGSKRTIIENALLKVGFFIPEINATQWYRSKLESTGIQYIMILGTPVLANRAAYENNGGAEKAQADEEILRSFRPEYNERVKENQFYDNRRSNKTDKTALVVYNTK